MKSPGTVSPKLSRSITHTLQAITLQLRRVLQTDLHVTVVVFPSPDADVYTNQNTFLREIHTRFLKFVQPTESLLMDELVAGGIMSSDDEKEVSAKETRRGQSQTPVENPTSSATGIVGKQMPARDEEALPPCARKSHISLGWQGGSN